LQIRRSRRQRGRHVVDGDRDLRVLPHRKEVPLRRCQSRGDIGVLMLEATIRTRPPVGTPSGATTLNSIRESSGATWFPTQRWPSREHAKSPLTPEDMQVGPRALACRTRLMPPRRVPLKSAVGKTGHGDAEQRHADQLRAAETAPLTPGCQAAR
jgi:hypothetical protein